jgi:hypothetical protein
LFFVVGIWEDYTAVEDTQDSMTVGMKELSESNSGSVSRDGRNIAISEGLKRRVF